MIVIKVIIKFQLRADKDTPCESYPNLIIRNLIFNITGHNTILLGQHNIKNFFWKKIQLFRKSEL